SASEVTVLAEEIFPGLVNELAGGPPKLPVGQAITGYPTDDTAQVDLGDGKRGVIESTVPMAVEAAGQRVPIDLSLAASGDSFVPVRPLVGLQIPKRLSKGVQLAESGVSLTPVDGQGSTLGGSEGSVVGVSVLYANTLTDADTVVKPATSGFQMDTLLRSVESPGQLSFRVALPEGGSLSKIVVGSGSVQVV